MSGLPRIELTATFEGRVVAQETFAGPGLRVTLGRADDCELRLDEVGVSRRHCVVFAQDGGLVLEDLGSVNGLFLAGKRITRRALVGTGEFSMCGFVVRYRAELEPRVQPAPSTLGRATFGDLTMQVTPAKVAAETRRVVVRPALRGHLVRVQSEGPQRVVMLHKGTFTIGSDAGADLSTSSGPRLAALLLRGDDAFEVLDVSPSGNAVKINGRAVEAASLAPDDELEVSGLKLIYRPGVPRAGGGATTRWVSRPK